MRVEQRGMRYLPRLLSLGSSAPTLRHWLMLLGLRQATPRSSASISTLRTRRQRCLPLGPLSQPSAPPRPIRPCRCSCACSRVLRARPTRTTSSSACCRCGSSGLLPRHIALCTSLRVPPLPQSFGPAQGGVTHVNFMVDPTDSTCAAYAPYWLDPALAFLPPPARLWGVWGEVQPSLTLHDPGCSAGSPPALVPMMATQGEGVAVWEWWVGPSDGVTAVLDAVRQQQA